MQPRIDIYPTHRHADFWLRPGRPAPFGASFVPGGVNFAVFSRYATGCVLVLFPKGEPEPLVEIPFPDEFRIGNVFAMIVFDLDHENIEYGFRMSGEYKPHAGQHFDPQRILLDPYARAISGRDVWGQPPRPGDIYPYPASSTTTSTGPVTATWKFPSKTWSSTKCTCAASPATPPPA